MCNSKIHINDQTISGKLKQVTVINRQVYIYCTGRLTFLNKLCRSCYKLFSSTNYSHLRQSETRKEKVLNISRCYAQIKPW